MVDKICCNPNVFTMIMATFKNLKRISYNIISVLNKTVRVYV